ALDKPTVWVPGDVVASTRYKSENQTLGYALRSDNHVIDFKYGWQFIPYEAFPNQRMDMLANNEHRANLRYTDQFDWGALEARAYHETVSHYMDFGDEKQFVYGGPLPAILAPGMPMYTAGINTGALAKASIVLSERDIVRAGAEAQRYRLNDWWPPSPSSLAGMVYFGAPATFGGMAPNTFWNINNGHRDRLGIFAEWEARWNQKWLSLFGARVEGVRMDAGPVQGYNNFQTGYVQSATTFNARSRVRTDTNPDLTALARYTPDDSRTFEFGYALKTRSPNLYERYAWSQNSMAMEMVNFVGDGNGYLGNPDLKPEQAHTLSATFDWHDANQTWDFKAIPYFTHVNGFIDAVRCQGVNGVATAVVKIAGQNTTCGGTANVTAVNKFVLLQYANQSARLYGVDLSAHLPLVNAGAWGELGFTGVLNYVNGKNRTTGDNLYNIMPLNTKLAVTQKLGGWNNRVELQLVEAKKDLSSVRQEVRTGGYGLLNLYGSYEWKQVRFDLGVENALNKLYSLPLGGAYTGQGATMVLTGVSWGVPVPGMGRSVNAGVTVKF
ncbi:MAG TPA: TonB-dependent receptor, partial [Gallionella sp.]|nr:TonB-dependent receptor [Gallionella sp.]